MSKAGRSKVIMFVGAHPDDIEVCCGATVKKLVTQGNLVYFLVVSMGENGGRRSSYNSEQLISIREEEQRRAAKMLGVQDVQLLKKPDSFVINSDELQEQIAYWIRRWKPDTIFTHDPTVRFVPWGTPATGPRSEINHSDHIAVGEATLAAIYPRARGRLFYPQHMKEGLEPHAVSDLFLWNTNAPNHWEDINGFLEAKVEAVTAHVSQFPHSEKVGNWLCHWAAAVGEEGGLLYAERFQYHNMRSVM